MPTQTFYNLDKEKQERIINASVEQFSLKHYEQVNLSDIIKNSKIPRGSFYQYFENKEDLYKYIFDNIKDRKLEYMKDLLPNPLEIPFLVLLKELYCRGIQFALENPKYVKISKFLFDTKGTLYNDLIGNGLELAKSYYIEYVNTDKRLGRIREDVDSSLLADLFIQATTQIAFDEIIENENISKERLLKRIDGLITILKKGIE